MSKMFLASIGAVLSLSVMGTTAFAQGCSEETEIVSEEGYALTRESQTKVGGGDYGCEKSINVQLKVENGDKISALELVQIQEDARAAIYSQLRDYEESELFCLVKNEGMYATGTTVTILMDVICYGPTVESLGRASLLNYIKVAKKTLPYNLTPTYPPFPSGAVVHN